MNERASVEALLQDITTTRNSLQTDRLDMSFGEIMSMYEREEIIIDPEFQRYYRWTDYQKTRFIESILLGIPTPPIFVAENDDGRWELVDGLQRLSTILSFFGLLRTKKDKNNWTLEDGELVKSLEGYTLEDLPMKLRLNIRRVACRVEIIKWNSEYDMRFELFNRLNTGGTPLTNQEIRNCIFRGTSSKFNDFLKKLADNQIFIKLIKPTKKQDQELYLEELVLRFMALYKNKESDIKSKIGKHMTDFMRKAVHNNDFDYAKYEELFNRTIKILDPLDYQVFRSKNGKFSTAYYDVIMLGLSQNIKIYQTEPAKIISDKIESLVKKGKNITNMTGTNAITGIRNRIRLADEGFKNL